MKKGLQSYDFLKTWLSTFCLNLSIDLKILEDDEGSPVDDVGEEIGEESDVECDGEEDNETSIDLRPRPKFQ